MIVIFYQVSQQNDTLIYKKWLGRARFQSVCADCSRDKNMEHTCKPSVCL
jgi:hypothetical protein